MNSQDMWYPSLRHERTLLLHYKSVRLGEENNSRNSGHTNIWEIAEIVRVFNSRGWSVELVDRTTRKWTPTRKYDLFLSNASGNSGQEFSNMARQIPSVFKVLYAAGPHSDVSNHLIEERYSNFYLRNPDATESPRLRIIDRVKTSDVLHEIEEIVCVDDNGWSSNTYSSAKKPIHRLRPSSAPTAFDPLQLSRNRDPKSILLFLGNGFIVKGADLAIEAVREFPNLTLTLCGPYKSDELFWQTYKNELKRKHRLFGFVTIGSKKYFQAISTATWQFHYSAAEGCATSVTTLLQAGLIPISNIETGVEVSGCGISIPNDSSLIENTVRSIGIAISKSSNEIQAFRHAVYEKALDFNQTQFRQNILRLVERWESKI